MISKCLVSFQLNFQTQNYLHTKRVYNFSVGGGLHVNDDVLAKPTRRPDVPGITIPICGIHCCIL